MPAKHEIVAIAYDFDGTLSRGYMQERNFFPALKITPANFWSEVKEHARKHDMDEILAYMELMIRKAKEKDLKITQAAFEKHGKNIEFFPGVEEWFGRVNAHSKELGLSVEHYIISSGLREFISGTSIAKQFKQIFASGFRYDQHGVAVWPALAVNYTNKAQFLFRINKGIEGAWDNSIINQYTPEEKRRVPFKNMIYLGDGETDIPAMKMTTYQGGLSIAVYPPRKQKAKEQAHRLVTEENRADAAVRADYSPGKPLEKLIFARLRQIAASVELMKMRLK